MLRAAQLRNSLVLGLLEHTTEDRHSIAVRCFSPRALYVFEKAELCGFAENPVFLWRATGHCCVLSPRLPAGFLQLFAGLGQPGSGHPPSPLPWGDGGVGGALGNLCSVFWKRKMWRGDAGVLPNHPASSPPRVQLQH